MLNLTADEQATVTAQGWNADSLATVLASWNPEQDHRPGHLRRVAAIENGADDTGADYRARFAPSPEQIEAALAALAGHPDWIAAVPLAMPGKESRWWTVGQPVEHPDGVWAGANTFDAEQSYAAARNEASLAASRALGDRPGSVAYAAVHRDGTWAVFDDVRLYVAPCDAAFVDADDARDHEAHCGACAGAREMHAAQAGVVERFIVVRFTVPETDADDEAERVRLNVEGWLRDDSDDKATDVTAELRDPREVIDPETAQEWEDETRTVIDGLPACNLTCSEAEAIGAVLREADKPELADRLIREHGSGDNDSEDEHHDLYDPEHVCPE